MIRLGELTVDRLSQFLFCLDVGVSPFPWVLHEKSGSLAAMRAHGLPVLVTGENLVVRGLKVKMESLETLGTQNESEPGLFQFHADLQVKRFPFRNTWEFVAKKFLDCLPEQRANQ